VTALHDVEQACTDMTAQGQPVTFTAIAARTGLSRATLYRQEPLKAIIDEHRAHQREARTLSGLTTEIGHLRTAVEAIAATVKHHEEQIRRLNRRTT
jgi:AcrR family transcriptional regulator